MESENALILYVLNILMTPNPLVASKMVAKSSIKGFPPRDGGLLSRGGAKTLASPAGSKPLFEIVS
jgi:hypothetical protein